MPSGTVHEANNGDKFLRALFVEQHKKARFFLFLFVAFAGAAKD
jgi:hypothetical protein